MIFVVVVLLQLLVLGSSSFMVSLCISVCEREIVCVCAMMVLEGEGMEYICIKR